jgi:hypothetical protein
MSVLHVHEIVHQHADRCVHVYAMANTMITTIVLDTGDGV